MTQKRILIAGETGFMRQNIVEALLSDPENVVVAVDFLTPGDIRPAQHLSPPDTRFEQHLISLDDVQNLVDIVATCEPQAIINIAAEHIAAGNSEQTLSPNIIGMTRLLRAIRTWSQTGSGTPPVSLPRFIQVSCVDYAGDGAAQPPHRVCSDANTTRAADTTLASRMVELARREYGLPAINVTTANTFGPYQGIEHFVPRTIDALIQQRTTPVLCETRDWVFAEDAADAVIFLSQFGVPGQPYAVDSVGGRHSDLALAELICDQLDQIMPRQVGSYRDCLLAAPALASYRRYDAAGVQRLRDELEWKPLNDFHCSLAATVRWYVEQSTWWEHSSLVAGPTLHNAHG